LLLLIPKEERELFTSSRPAADIAGLLVLLFGTKEQKIDLKVLK